MAPGMGKLERFPHSHLLLECQQRPKFHWSEASDLEGAFYNRQDSDHPSVGGGADHLQQRQNCSVWTSDIPLPGQFFLGLVLGKVSGNTLFFFFFFFFCFCSMWKFLGQGLNPHQRSDPGHCSDTAWSLTQCTTRELWKHGLDKLAPPPLLMILWASFFELFSF